MQPSFWITVLLSIVLAHSLPLNGVETSPLVKPLDQISGAAKQDPSSRRQLADLLNPIPDVSPTPPVNSTSPPTPSSSSEPSSTSTSTSTPSSTETQTSLKRNVLKRKPLPQQVAPPHTTLSRRQIENIKRAINRAPRSPAPSARAIKESRNLERPAAPLAAPPVKAPVPSPRDLAARTVPVTLPSHSRPDIDFQSLRPPPSPPASSPELALLAAPPNTPAGPTAPSPVAFASSPPSPSPRDLPVASSESVKMSAAPRAALLSRQFRAPDNSAGSQANNSASGSEDAKAHAEEEATPANKKHDTHNAQDQAKERRNDGLKWNLGKTFEFKHSAGSEHESELARAMTKGSEARSLIGRMEEMVKVQ